MRVRTIASRGALVLGGAVTLFVIYRLFTAYTWRGGECPPVSGQVVPNTEAIPPIRVMTFNIEGHASLVDSDHIAEIAEVIRKARPDIVGLQEVHRNTWQSRRSDQLAQLSRATGMRGTFGSALHSLGGEFGNAVLTRGEIIGTRVYDLPSIGEPRSLLRATVRIDGATMDVYVTHLAAWGKFARNNRENQLRCILGIVAPSPNPWLLMGDFNADSDSPEMQPLLYGGAIHTSGDVQRASHKITGERLDYLFADPGWVTMSSAVLSVDPSDHRPVMSELRHGGAQ